MGVKRPFSGKLCGRRKKRRAQMSNPVRKRHIPALLPDDPIHERGNPRHRFPMPGEKVSLSYGTPGFRGQSPDRDVPRIDPVETAPHQKRHSSPGQQHEDLSDQGGLEIIGTDHRGRIERHRGQPFPDRFPDNPLPFRF